MRTFLRSPNRVFVSSVLLLAGVIVLGAVVLGGTGGTSAGEPGDPDRVARFIEQEMSASNIPGVAIALVKPDGTTETRGFGDDGAGNAITGDTPFWVGSNAKSVTALAVMQLAEAGLIDLDATVRTYLPNFAVKDPIASREITVRHLLNQTSGFSRADGIEPYLEQRDETLEKSVAALRNVSLNRPVGESFEYSNLNYVVLGLIVQEVSGESWADYATANILEPLGMTRTFTSLDEAKAAGLTRTHRTWFGMPFESQPKYLRGLAPTGWLYSTANDMARYAQMYLNDGELDGVRVLSEDGITEMLTGATNTVERPLQGTTFTYAYGAGWFDGPFGAANEAAWHLGNLPEFTAWVVLLPETDEAVVVLINAGSQAEFIGANSVMSRLPIGVVNLVRGEDAPGGTTLAQFGAILITLFAAVVAIQLWSLVRVVRRTGKPARAWGWTTALVPFAWEFVAAAFITWTIASGPGGWTGSFHSLPDVTLVMAVVAGTWIATGLTRGAWLVRALLAGRSSAAEGAAHPVGGRPTPT